MQILYCYWGEHPANDMIQAFRELGHNITQFPFQVKDYSKDPAFSGALTKALSAGSFDCLFSFDFFPLISEVAHNLQIPYLSWIYDMPHTTLFSPQAYSDINYVFLFDRSFMEQLKSLNDQAHFYYLPLAVNTKRVLSYPCNISHKVSFVGSLYEKCLYNQIHYLPDNLKGYLEGFFTAQTANYLFHLTDEIMTDSIYQQLKKWVSLELSNSYRVSDRSLYLDLLEKKVTNLDRTVLLKACSENFPLSFYSGSPKSALPKADYLGFADYETEMPVIFRGSKINLNFTLRSIQTGIPLRCMDIMGCGGFLMSSYQPELDELFVDGEEMVLFFTKEDMMDKISFYLSHEKERVEIAHNGLSKIQSLYTYTVQTDCMLKAVF